MADTYEKVFTYERIVFVDAVLFMCHIIFMFILWFQFLMLIPLVMIRIPRIGLHIAGRKMEDKPDIKKLEYLFRRISFFLYFPVAMLFQLITMLTNYCADSETKSACARGYMISMFIFLAIHTVIDYFCYKAIKTQFEANAPPPKSSATEMTVKDRA